MIQVAAITSQGIRPANQDRIMVQGLVLDRGAIAFEQENGLLLVVCDGVGGEKFGDEAAQITAALFAFLEHETIDISLIRRYLSLANEQLYNAQSADADHANMSTTIAGIYLNDDDYIAFNVGDSKVYRFRTPYITQLSTDHTLIRSMIESGAADENDPDLEAYQHVLVQYLGCRDGKQPSIVDGTDRLFEDDIYLICSDGISDVVSEKLLEEILAAAKPIEDLCSEIFAAAVDNGSEDNISLILAKRS